MRLSTAPHPVPAASRASVGPTRTDQPSDRRAHHPWRVGVLVAGLLIALGLAGFAVAARRPRVISALTRPGAAAVLAPAADGAPDSHVDPIAMRQVGLKAYKAGDYELARRFFIRAIAADPTDREAHEALGCALLHLGRPGRAQQQFKLAGSEHFAVCP